MIQSPVVDWSPPALLLKDGRVFAPRHAWCVGRNYAEHAREMGADPARETPLFFTKPATALVQRERIDFPAATQELHHEIELVALLGRGGRDLTHEQAEAAVFGYAAGCDLTRRDVQARAKAEGKPWALAKGFDQSGALGRIVPATEWRPTPEHNISLRVNHELRQRATLGEMIWPVAELIARLSQEISLYPGDVVFTGTPAGVGPLRRGDHVEGLIDGLPAFQFRVC